MEKEFIERWEADKHLVEEQFKTEHPACYKSIVTAVVKVLTSGEYGSPDPERIHEINDGDYQGTLLYLIADNSYQPSDYWFVKVSYGSCSGCDTLEGIGNYSSEPPDEDQVKQYMTLALHIVQGLKPLGGELT